MAADQVREVLRALADVRDGAFYLLWVDLTRHWPDPMPDIRFRIYRIADTHDAVAVVGVDGTRPDGTALTWSVAVTARSDGLVVEGAVETQAPDGALGELFSRRAECHDPAEAAALVRTVATDVVARHRPR